MGSNHKHRDENGKDSDLLEVINTQGRVAHTHATFRSPRVAKRFVLAHGQEEKANPSLEHNLYKKGEEWTLISIDEGTVSTRLGSPRSRPCWSDAPPIPSIPP